MKKLAAALLLLFAISSCHSQPSSPFAPEAGTYSGIYSTLDATYVYGYSPISAYNLQFTPQMKIYPAPMGEMVITQTGTNKGTYRFPRFAGWEGSWTYDPAANKLQFTGKLKDAVQLYTASKGVYRMQLLIKSNAKDSGMSYHYSLKASKPFPKKQAPNGKVAGLFTIKPDSKSIALFDAATGKPKFSFTGSVASTNRNKITLSIGFTTDPHHYAITLFKPTGEATLYSSEQIVGWGHPFSDYSAGVLANDNRTVALLGRTIDKVQDLTYTPGENSIAIVDLPTGKLKAVIPSEPNQFVKPAFLADGRLVYCPKAGGIAITDATYTSSKIVYTNPLNAFAVSPDGKRLAISEGLGFYTLNIDGSNKKPIVCDNEPLQAGKAEEVKDLDWSPDGKFLILYYGRNAINLLIVPLDGGAYYYVKDDDGEPIQQVNWMASWNQP